MKIYLEKPLMNYLCAAIDIFEDEKTEKEKSSILEIETGFLYKTKKYAAKISIEITEDENVNC